MGWDTATFGFPVSILTVSAAAPSLPARSVTEHATWWTPSPATSSVHVPAAPDVSVTEEPSTVHDGACSAATTGDPPPDAATSSVTGEDTFHVCAPSAVWDT